jgi:hypothetical protein
MRPVVVASLALDGDGPAGALCLPHAAKATATTATTAAAPCAALISTLYPSVDVAETTASVPADFCR